MPTSLVVSSASSLGYGALRCFEEPVGWTTFGPPDIKDPRGVRRRAKDGGACALDGMYYVGSRSQRSIEQVDLSARRYCGPAVALDGISFPRGFAVRDDGGFVVASGTHPVRGGGRRGLFLYNRNGSIESNSFVDDPLLDPLDLALHGGYLYVTSEFPFGADDAVVSLRRYDANPGVRSRAKTARNCVLAVDVTTLGSAWLVAEDEHLAGQSLALGSVN
jgi:hypothetical protein